MAESSRNYQNGKIYCIRNCKSDDIYIGSTTQALSKRMEKHRSDFKKKNMTIPRLHEQMNEHGLENFYIELVEKYPCESLEELRAKEGEWIRKRGTLNKCVAGRSREQYREDNKEQIRETKQQYWINNKEQLTEKNNQYYYDNKEPIQEQRKEYYQNHKLEFYERNKRSQENNRDKLREYHKEYKQNNLEQINLIRKAEIICECGLKFQNCNKSRHLKSKHHQNFILNNNIDNVFQEETNTEKTAPSHIN